MECENCGTTITMDNSSLDAASSETLCSNCEYNQDLDRRQEEEEEREVSVLDSGLEDYLRQRHIEGTLARNGFFLNL